MMNVTMATDVIMKRPTKVFEFASQLFYNAIRAIARPAAWLCYGLDISSNLITCTRFMSPLVFLWLAMDSAPLWQYLVAVAFFGYTDAVDGVLAGPNFEDKPQNDGGAMLDPLADKFFVVSIYMYHYTNFPKLIIITAVGEVLIAALALSFIATIGNTGKMRANMWGKAKLFLEVVTLVVGVSVIFFLMGSLYSKVRKVLP
ncbi:MAG: hypothetical protein M1275_00060 [Patescibacteria group bacterium]|nr:hypothetical protein [Patescibacteria group bacterium]